MIIEKLKTPIIKDCDVLVCGGGFAGISAALSAARQGKKVILLEKQYTKPFVRYFPVRPVIRLSTNPDSLHIMRYNPVKTTASTTVTQDFL